LSGPIYLMRHGETVWNRERRFQGRLDSPLTELGLAQARRMGETLAPLVADRDVLEIVASPLGRARATATAVADVLGIAPGRIASDARLTEIDVGIWSGLTFSAIAERWPGSITEANRRDWFFRSPDGETYEAIAARVRSFLDDAVAPRPPERFRLRRIRSNLKKESSFIEMESQRDSISSDTALVVVAHGVTSRLLRGLYLGLPRSDLLRLELSQDAIFKLADGRVERIATRS
jgi:broad specificity phosphatase PhoE